MKRLIQVVLATLVLLVAYLALWPVAIQPNAFAPKAAPLYQGDYQANDSLASFEALSLNGDVGPEGIAADSNYLYAATEAGTIYRWSRKSLTDMAAPQLTAEAWVNTNGRPLGITSDNSGGLWVADAFQGLMHVNANGEIQLILSSVAGTKILYANDVALAPNGKLYLTDSTTRHDPVALGGTYPASLVDILEHGYTGRLIEYSPATGEAKIIAQGYSFSNGVAVSIDGSYLVFAETSEYRVHKLWLEGPQKGDVSVLVDNLPGFPDNIYRAPNDDRFWMGFTSPRKAIVDNLADKPWARKMIQRLPGWVRPKASLYGHVVAFDGDGAIVGNLQDPQAGYPLTTGALELDGYLYISSLTADKLARVKQAP